jgi:hypothetical protein
LLHGGADDAAAPLGRQLHRLVVRHDQHVLWCTVSSM